MGWPTFDGPEGEAVTALERTLPVLPISARAGEAGRWPRRAGDGVRHAPAQEVALHPSTRLGFPSVPDLACVFQGHD